MDTYLVNIMAIFCHMVEQDISAGKTQISPIKARHGHTIFDIETIETRV